MYISNGVIKSKFIILYNTFYITSPWHLIAFCHKLDLSLENSILLFLQRYADGGSRCSGKLASVVFQGWNCHDGEFKACYQGLHHVKD